MHKLEIDDGFMERIMREAESGDENSQAMLGACYIMGYEIEENIELGFALLEKSVAAGSELGDWFLFRFKSYFEKKREEL